MNNKHNKDRKVYFIILINVSPQSGEKMKRADVRRSLQLNLFLFLFWLMCFPAKEIIVFLIKCF